MTKALLNKIAGTDIPDNEGNAIKRITGRFTRQTAAGREKATIEHEIVESVQAYVVSTIHVPTEESEPWWKKLRVF